MANERGSAPEISGEAEDFRIGTLITKGEYKHEESNL